MGCAQGGGEVRCLRCGDPDGFCPFGCDRPTDADCAPAAPQQTCPDVYLGSDLANSPPDPFYSNKAIDVPAKLISSAIAVVQVAARNHGNLGASNVLVEFFWGNPEDGCAAHQEHRLGDAVLEVPGATALSDGVAFQNFRLDVTPELKSTNGGDICLLVRISMPAFGSCLGQTFGSDVSVDPRQAVRYIRVE